MEQVLADIYWQICLVYLERIRGFGNTFMVAWVNLYIVLVQLQGTYFKLKPTKKVMLGDHQELGSPDQWGWNPAFPREGGLPA